VPTSSVSRGIPAECGGDNLFALWNHNDSHYASRHVIRAIHMNAKRPGVKMTKTHEPAAPASTTTDLLRHACSIVVAYLAKNHIAQSELPGMIRSVHGALGTLSGGTASDMGVGLKPAVPVKKSIMPDYIVCLEDGKKLKMLKRYLRGKYKLSPDDYRAKWGLPADYPMVAPNYAALRSQFAKDNGLGRRSPPAKGKRRRG
jgi:predicted transcriptional regulator